MRNKLIFAIFNISTNGEIEYKVFAAYLLLYHYENVLKTKTWGNKNYISFS